MKFTIYPATLYPQEDGAHMLAWLRKQASIAGREDVLIDDAERADCILFFAGHGGWDSFRIAALFHPLRRLYPEKTLLYHDSDYAVPILPGLYPSLLKRHHRPGWAEGAPYFARQVSMPAMSQAALNHSSIRWLASFVGAANCSVRREILTFKDHRVFVKDTSKIYAWKLPEDERTAFQMNYAKICSESHYVLSPRGVGPSTYRQYEAWEVARCPVILSDEWVPAPGIPWDQGIVYLPEDAAKNERSLLNRLESIDAETKGKEGKKIHDAYLSDGRAFEYLIEQLKLIMDAAPRPITLANAFRLIMSSPRRDVFAISIKQKLLKRHRLRDAWL